MQPEWSQYSQASAPTRLTGAFISRLPNYGHLAGGVSVRRQAVVPCTWPRQV